MNISRIEMFARFIIENNATIRGTANVFGYSKSTVHNDVSNELKKYNYSLSISHEKDKAIAFVMVEY